MITFITVLIIDYCKMPNKPTTYNVSLVIIIHIIYILFLSLLCMYCIYNKCSYNTDNTYYCMYTNPTYEAPSQNVAAFLLFVISIK